MIDTKKALRIFLESLLLMLAGWAAAVFAVVVSN